MYLSTLMFTIQYAEFLAFAFWWLNLGRFLFV
jgi:hypothetical protein